MVSYQTLLVAESNGVLTLTLNRPERKNALNPTIVNELLHALDAATTSESVRSIVLTGSGNAFCVGADFVQMTAESKGDPLPIRGDFKDLLLAMWRTTKPVVARVNGHAL